jgi:aminopeptidase N
MKHFIIYIFIVSFAINLFAENEFTCCHLEDPGLQPVDMVVDVQHIKADLFIDGPGQFVEGTAEIAVKALRTQTDSIIFQVPDISVNKVTINGVEAESRYINGGQNIVIYPQAEMQYRALHNIKIEYRAEPKRELFFTGWNDPAGIKRKQIWAHSPNHWLPFINQKHDILTSEIIVRFDSDYKVFSNGYRENVTENNDGTTTWHYKMKLPHVVYLICLVIGDYEYESFESYSGLPLEYWYYPGQKDNYDITYKYSREMFDFIEDETGVKYPWGLYRQVPVADYLFGAMETTTSTVFGDYMYHPPRAWWMRNYVNVNAHELVHQWFGNYVSHLNNVEVWLTESFATYYAKKFEQSVFGDDYYQFERDKELTRTFNAAKQNTNPIRHSRAGTDRWYPKGSLVLDMLRDLMGEEEFKTAINYYLEKNSHEVTETYDLVKAIRESTGMALNWFFEQWIYRGGEPHYKISYEEIKKEGEMFTRVTVGQIHRTDKLVGYFRMPIEFEVHYKDGSGNSVKEWVGGQKTVVDIPNSKGGEIDFVIFDPNRKIIKQVTFERSLEELKSQAANAPDMIDSYDALVAMRDYPFEDKIDFFKKEFNTDNYHMQDGEIAFQMAPHLDKYPDFTKKIIAHPEVFVRRKMLENYTKISLEYEKDFRKLLKDTCFTNAELAFHNLAYSFPENVDDYLDIMKNETGWRGMNLRMKWLEIAIFNGREEYLDELKNYTAQSYGFETRKNAFNTLKSLNYCDSESAGQALKAALYWNFHTSGAAKDYIRHFSKNQKHLMEFRSELEKGGFSETEKSELKKIIGN